MVRLVWTHPFVDLSLGTRLLSGPGLVDGVEEFGVEMESYLVCFLHDNRCWKCRTVSLDIVPGL